jgi:hypothetical protein
LNVTNSATPAAQTVAAQKACRTAKRAESVVATDGHIQRLARVMVGCTVESVTF